MRPVQKDAKEVQLELFADYHQVCVLDDDIDAGWAESFDDLDMKAGMAVTPRAVTVFTARNMTVPVTVCIASGPPEEEQGFPGWDHVVQAGLHLPSGRLVLMGITDYFPDAQRLDVAPGHHVIRAYSAGLETLSWNGLEGEDRYRIVLWPGHSEGRTVLKQGRP